MVGGKVCIIKVLVSVWTTSWISLEDLHACTKRSMPVTSSPSDPRSDVLLGQGLGYIECVCLGCPYRDTGNRKALPHTSLHGSESGLLSVWMNLGHSKTSHHKR